jgi:hypothetical protein
VFISFLLHARLAVAASYSSLLWTAGRLIRKGDVSSHFFKFLDLNFDYFILRNLLVGTTLAWTIINKPNLHITFSLPKMK